MNTTTENDPIYDNTPCVSDSIARFAAAHNLAGEEEISTLMSEHGFVGSHQHVYQGYSSEHTCDETLGQVIEQYFQNGGDELF